MDVETALAEGKIVEYVNSNYYAIDKETLSHLVVLFAKHTGKATQLKVLNDLKEIK